MYITPTNKDQEGKEFIFIVTGDGFTENKYGKWQNGSRSSK